MGVPGSEQREDLIAVVEERFGRLVAETRDALRGEMHEGFDGLHGEMHAGFMDTQKQFLQQQQQIDALRADVNKEIGAVRKEITTQTRWLLTVLVAATVLIPVMQRVLATLFP